MSQRSGIQPYFTNHSLRATTVTILSSVNVETRQIKAVTGHKSDASIESYCERPTLDQFQRMSSALTSFIQGKENTPPSRTASSSASESMKGAMEQNSPAEVVVSPRETSISATKNDENVLFSNGVSPNSAIG